MRATWSMTAGLEITGQHTGQPRVWTVTAWAKVPSGEKERITVTSKKKLRLADLINLINQELALFEKEKGETADDAGFVAIAR